MPHQVRQDKLFHVKPYEPSVAKICLHIFMTEAIKVGLRLYRSPNIARRPNTLNPILTISVKGMDLYLSVEPFHGGFLCAAVAVPLLPRFSWSRYL